MLAIDFIWLKFIIGDFFFKEIGKIANPNGTGFQINYIAGLFVYILMTLAIMIFVLPQATSKTNALLLGALLGFISYGIFDGTNLAIFTDYSTKMAIIDIAWGTFIMGIGALSAYLLQTEVF